MGATAFDKLLGTLQGRVQPAGWQAPDGAYVFVLGCDAPGQIAECNPGDYTQVTQTGNFAGAALLRVRARLRGPAAAPAPGVSWRASLLIDGVEIVQWALEPGRTRTLADVAWPCAHLAGDHVLGFKLELVGAGGPYACELPAFYADAITLGAAARPVIVNRSPEPNEDRVPHTAPIVFDLADVGPDGIDLASIAVTVNGTSAYTAGAAANGYTATILQPEADVVRLSLTPPAPWASAEAVTVGVLAATLVSALPLAASYVFTALRTTPPALLSATALEQRVVRLVWDEPVRMALAAHGDDALNPAAYAIARVAGAPAVAVAVASVAAASSSSADLTLDIPMTPGAAYTVTVTGVADLVGNVSAPTTNAASYTGWQPPWPADRDFDLYAMLPSMNRSEDVSLDLQKFTACLQEVLDLLLLDVDRFTDLVDPDVAPIAFVDAMLADLGNPFTFSLSAADKRRLAQLLVAIYQAKGTTPGMIGVVGFFVGISITIDAIGYGTWSLGASLLGVDTVLGSSDPYTLNSFTATSPVTLTAAQAEQITQILEYMKPAESHFVRLIQPAPPPPAYDPLVLGVSRLGVDWLLH